jgi:hypothetical protein
MGDDNTKDLTSNQVKHIPNPTGKGGFKDHPENRADGKWDSKNTFSYQINRFKNMPVKEFLAWPTITSEDIRTMAEELAWKRVFESRKSLKDFKEIANRTEGMPKQSIEGKFDGVGIDVASLVKTVKEIMDDTSANNSEGGL